MRDPTVLAALAGTAALALAVLVVWLAGLDGDTTETADRSTSGTTTEESTTTSSTTAPSNADRVGGGADDTSDAGLREIPTDLPPPTFNPAASPPTTDSETIPSEYPLDPLDPSNTLPLIGEFVVDLEPEGYLDFAVHLEQGKMLAILSSADDGIFTHIEVYLPDGSLEGSWDGGEPQQINGLAWVTPDDLVPTTGTFVIRVIHLGGEDGPFALSIYG